MEVVAHILVVLMALEFFYIAYLEICATSSETSSKYLICQSPSYHCVCFRSDLWHLRIYLL